jgi:hypothetical protein
MQVGAADGGAREFHDGVVGRDENGLGTLFHMLLSGTSIDQSFHGGIHSLGLPRR